MQTKIVEATNGEKNWGKFLVGRFDQEWVRRPAAPGCEVSMPLLRAVGWSADHVLVLDLQTGEGALFAPHGLAAADLDKHRVWVCALFEPFLAWLYAQDLRELAALPDHVDLPDAPFAMAGYRRAGPKTG